jgi:predicted transcriptional regulator
MTQSTETLPDLQERAAVLLAENRLSDSDIAATLGVSRASISRWKRRPEFQTRVTVLQQRINEVALQTAIADREKRVAALNDRWERMQRVLDERAADPGVASAPGGTTGLVVKQMKMIGAGEAAMPITEYAVDTSLLKEMRATEQQAAQELGQWSEKSETKTEQHVTFTIDFDRAGDS